MTRPRIRLFLLLGDIIQHILVCSYSATMSLLCNCPAGLSGSLPWRRTIPQLRGDPTEYNVSICHPEAICKNRDGLRVENSGTHTMVSGKETMEGDGNAATRLEELVPLEAMTCSWPGNQALGSSPGLSRDGTGHSQDEPFPAQPQNHFTLLGQRQLFGAGGFAWRRAF